MGTPAGMVRGLHEEGRGSVTRPRAHDQTAWGGGARVCADTSPQGPVHGRGGAETPGVSPSWRLGFLGYDRRSARGRTLVAGLNPNFNLISERCRASRTQRQPLQPQTGSCRPHSALPCGRARQRLCREVRRRAAARQSAGGSASWSRSGPRAVRTESVVRSLPDEKARALRAPAQLHGPGGSGMLEEN